MRTHGLFVAALAGLASVAGAQTEALSVRVDTIAPGAYHVMSSFFASFAIVQGDSMIVVDLPDTEARSRAILDTLRSRFPTTPVRLVVISHHHLDHAAGLPLVFAAGIPVVMHDANRAFLSGRDTVRGVRDSLVVGSGANELRLYAVSNAHANGMLIGYLPGRRLLSAPDLSEFGAWDIERSALVDHVARLGLVVDRVVPGHNRVRPWSDFDPRATSDAARRVLQRAVDAAGGERALRAIATVRESLSVVRFRVGGGQWPGAPLPPMRLEGIQTTDFPNGRTVFSGERRSGGDAGAFRIVATPTAGAEQLFSFTVPFDDDSLRARRGELALSPMRLLTTALDGTCRMDEPAHTRLATRAVSVLRCTHPNVGLFKVRLDSTSAWPLEVETQRPSRVYERENFVSTFSGFRRVTTPSGPLMLPSIVEIKLDGRPFSVVTYARTEVVATPNDSIFDTRRANLRPIVRVQEIAPGVAYLESDSLYYALAVSLDTGIMLIETAETETRTRAMLDSVRAHFRGVRISSVVVTHHHADHIVGLPAVFDAEIPAITHADAASTIRAIARVAASRNPINPPVVTVVRDSLVIGAGTAREIRLYALQLAEAATHLVAYLPRQRILFAADVAEGARNAPVSASSELLQFIRSRGLAVDRVLSAHSGAHAVPN